MANATNDFVAIPGTVPTPFGRVLFNQCFEVDDKGKFSLMLAFKKDDINSPEFKAMKDCLNQAAAEKFGCKTYKGPYVVTKGDKTKEHDLNSPFKTSDDYDFLEDDEVGVRLKSKYKPQIVDADGETYLESDVDFYSGCIARAMYTATAYDVDANRGTQFQLESLQKVGVGKRFVGQRKPAAASYGAVAQDPDVQDMPNEEEGGEDTEF